MMGGRERANLTRPRRAMFTAATMSRSITILHFPHQSLRCSLLSDWSLSPHLGQVTLEPLVSDRKSTRLNSSHSSISYAVFCLKKKKNKIKTDLRKNTQNNMYSYTCDPYP